MALDTSEEEQVEKIQSFFRENGWFLAIALAAVLGGNFGYRTWEDQKAANAAAASDAFTAFQEAARQTDGADTSALIAQGEAVLKDHKDSQYALLAGLQLAKIQFDADDISAAEATLRGLSDRDNALLEPLIQVRLARVLGAQNRAEEGLTLLSQSIDWAGFTSNKYETEGDLLYQLGRMDEARQAYQLAVNTAGEGQQTALTMKVEDLTYARSTSAGALEDEIEPSSDETDASIVDEDDE